MPSDNPHLELLQHYHGEAAEYHRHFSSMRTGALSIAVPIFVISSIEIANNAGFMRTGGAFALAFLFVLILFAACHVLNIVFAAWSTNCRHIERYYESCIDLATEKQFAGTAASPAAAAYDDTRAPIGFRHLFRLGLKFSPMDGFTARLMSALRAKGSVNDVRPADATFDACIGDRAIAVWDPFTWTFVIFAAGYCVFYGFFLCGIVHAPAVP